MYRLLTIRGMGLIFMVKKHEKVENQDLKQTKPLARLCFGLHQCNFEVHITYKSKGQPS